MDSALLVICALLLNAVFGKWLQPPAALATYAREIERKLNRQHRSDSERAQRGWLAVGMAVAGGILVGICIQKIFYGEWRFVWLALLAMALPVRATYETAAQIRGWLRQNDLAKARQVLEGSVWRHHALMDVPALCRTSVEILMVQFLQKILSPICWFLVAGLPGLLGVKILTFLADYWPTNAQTQAFTQPLQRVLGWLHFFPARLMAALLLLSSLFTPQTRLPKDWMDRLADYASPPVYYVLTMSAAVLDMVLGGTMSVYSQSWIGSGRIKATIADISSAMHLFWILHLLLFLALGFLL